jgi:hypothetical protein
MKGLECDRRGSAAAMINNIEEEGKSLVFERQESFNQKRLQQQGGEREQLKTQQSNNELDKKGPKRKSKAYENRNDSSDENNAIERKNREGQKHERDPQQKLDLTDKNEGDVDNGADGQTALKKEPSKIQGSIKDQDNLVQVGKKQSQELLQSQELGELQLNSKQTSQRTKSKREKGTNNEFSPKNGKTKNGTSNLEEDDTVMRPSRNNELEDDPELRQKSKSKELTRIEKKFAEDFMKTEESKKLEIERKKSSDKDKEINMGDSQLPVDENKNIDEKTNNIGILKFVVPLIL